MVNGFVFDVPVAFTTSNNAVPSSWPTPAITDEVIDPEILAESDKARAVFGGLENKVVFVSPTKAKPKRKRAPSSPTKVTEKKSRKENEKLGAADPVVIGKESGATNWSADETKTLLEKILGPDATKIFEKLKKNPARVWKSLAADPAFVGVRNEKSIKGRYERLKKVYDYILAFESHTGNGGGDGDLDMDDDIALQVKIDAAGKAGKQCGNLNAKTVQNWHESGWYTLFNERLSEHPGLTRKVEHHSGKISDEEDSGSESESKEESVDGDEPEEPQKKRQVEPRAPPATPSAKQSISTAKGVPEPRHKHRSKNLSQGGEAAAEFFSANTSLLKSVQKEGQDRLELLRRKEDREDRTAEIREAREKAAEEREMKRQAEERMEARVKRAQEILKTDGLSAEVRAAAEKVVLDYFMA